MRHLMLLAAILASQGCIVNMNRDRSIGQELLELQQARAAGTITEDAYHARRSQVFSDASTLLPPMMSP
jgi:hypothetical protein